eukprot:1020775-Rhodomonas_salina.1
MGVTVLALLHWRVSESGWHTILAAARHCPVSALLTWRPAGLRVLLSHRDGVTVWPSAGSAAALATQGLIH